MNATVNSIRKLSAYEELDIYSMDIQYDYDLSRLTPQDRSIHRNGWIWPSVRRLRALS